MIFDFHSMKNRFFFALIIIVSITTQGGAQDVVKYRRSSLYSILIRHPNKEFSKDIDTVFRMVPIPDKFDELNLRIRAINAATPPKNGIPEEQNTINYTIKPFIENNDIAKRLVSKWFNRKEGKNGDGSFDMNRIIERGLYNADYFDYQEATLSVRGLNLLADAGEELLSSTFVIFNDIRYYDKDETIRWVKAVTGKGVLSKALQDLAGFRVSITTYLFQLDWNEENSALFYKEYYTAQPDEVKKNAYNQAKGLFSLKYIGSTTVVSSETTMRGVQTKNDIIRKVCERAIDKNIAKLQKEYEVFRVKTPLFSTNPLSAKIGMKEDIDEQSKFEALEMAKDSNGRTYYKRIGIIRPIKGRVWDNRYMAEFEEENEGNTLTATEFEVISGSGFYPGLLLRQIN